MDAPSLPEAPEANDASTSAADLAVTVVDRRRGQISATASLEGDPALVSWSPVLPGGRVALRVVVPGPGPFRIERLSIVGDADDWWIEDVRVCGRSQFAGGSFGCPGALFSMAVVDRPMFDPLPAGGDLTVVASYAGDDPAGRSLRLLLEVDSEVNLAPRTGATLASASVDLSRAVSLASGGSLSVSVSVDLSSISQDDRAFVFGLLDQVAAYERGR